MGEDSQKKRFIESYDEYADAIFRYCYYRVFDRERAREIMQESFTRTWEYISSGKEVENVRAFLYKVAHNLCVNEITRPRMLSLDEMKEVVHFDPPAEEELSTEDRAEITMLLAELTKLPESDKELLLLRYVEDLQVKDIAELLDLVPNTVSVKIKRAEEALRKIYTQKNGK